MVALVLDADRAGLRAPVPTTPDWTVRRLVAHQGMVHRWATATVQGLPADADALEQAGIDAADPLDWLADGAIDLVAALVRAPEDLAAPVFLHDAPAPREFWARRQCHETTIHAVDALAAHLGRLPRRRGRGLDRRRGRAGRHRRAADRLRHPAAVAPALPPAAPGRGGAGARRAGLDGGRGTGAGRHHPGRRR
jgi:hypothetical protein